MDDPLVNRVAAVAALDEPTRLRLYEHMARQAAPVGRDEVAAALGIARATVAFHLDKLVGEQLLEVTYERRTGRSGPGAGRPAKLYRRSQRDVAVSLPDRRYDLASQLLAAAIAESDRSGESARAILERRAHDEGEEIGESAAAAAQNEENDVDALLLALHEHGFEPRCEGDEVLLGNCPFHALAQTHAELVCGMNLHLVDGLLRGLGQTGMQAHLDPAPGRCCVRIAPEPPNR